MYVCAALGKFTFYGEPFFDDPTMKKIRLELRASTDKHTLLGAILPWQQLHQQQRPTENILATVQIERVIATVNKNIYLDLLHHKVQVFLVGNFRNHFQHWINI